VEGRLRALVRGTGRGLWSRSGGSGGPAEERERGALQGGGVGAGTAPGCWEAQGEGLRGALEEEQQRREAEGAGGGGAGGPGGPAGLR